MKRFRQPFGTSFCGVPKIPTENHQFGKVPPPPPPPPPGEKKNNIDKPICTRPHLVPPPPTPPHPAPHGARTAPRCGRGGAPRPWRRRRGSAPAPAWRRPGWRPSKSSAWEGDGDPVAGEGGGGWGVAGCTEVPWTQDERRRKPRAESLRSFQVILEQLLCK